MLGMGLDRVAGTTGITGAADSVWVLDTGKGEASAILHVTGRDIETKEIAMKLENGIWSILGPAEEVAMSEVRRSILNLLVDNGAMSPKTIADILRKNPNTLYALLFSMKRDGQIIQEEERGLYRLPPEKKQ